jgi:ABC-type cobalamin/Fe3+-siderophores transport system ATPase subunit
MVSHDLRMIPTRCSRVIVLERGKIVLDGKKEEILKSEILTNIFNGNGRRK